MNYSQSRAKFELGYGDYIRFRDLILERTGLYYPENKRDELENNLFRALNDSPIQPQNGFYDLGAYYKLLKNGSGNSHLEMNRLVSILTIGETYFFRDKGQMDALIYHVLPQLIAQKRAEAAALGPNATPQLRLWSAGCSSGEEPYSLAILLKRLINDIDRWNIFILGTDINQKALEKAKQASYSDWSFREPLSRELRSYYFSYHPATRRYKLNSEIGQMVYFNKLNLIEENYPALHNNTTNIDLIICRNVTIYLTEKDTQRIINRFYKCLNLNGWLVTGHSETSLVLYKAYQTHTFPGALLYQKTGHPTHIPAEWESFFKQESSTPILPNSNPTNAPLQTVRGKTNHLNSKNVPALKPQPQAKAKKHQNSDPDLYKQGRNLVSKGKLKEAIPILEAKVKEDANFAPAHSLLGRIHANLGDYGMARAWCQMALQIDKLSLEAYYVLALVDEHEGNWNSAVTMLEKAIYIDRTAPLPFFTLALLYQKLNKKAEAKRAAQNAIKLLEKWPAETIVPYTDNEKAGRLLQAARQTLATL